MDAFELLKTDHEKVSQLFKEIESASGNTKRNLFTRLKAELDVHAHIEEKVLYPALENTEEAREITLEAYEEHNVVKDLLAELATAGEIDDEWDAKLTVLKENVEHHVEEEEGELFSKARKALSQEEIDRIGVELEAEKSAAQGATGEKSRAAKSGKRSSTKAVSASSPAPTGTSGPRRKGPKGESQAESPGVLKRIANFIGLGDNSPTKASGKKASKKKTASKSSSTKGKSASKSSAGKAAGSKAAKKAPVKAKSGAKARVKAPAKRSSSKTGRTRATVGAETSRANKRQSNSGGRKSATKAASRASSKKRTGSTATKRKRTR